MGKIIDISKWQGKINFSKAAPELDLAILRASVGLSKDERFDDLYPSAGNAGGCRIAVVARVACVASSDHERSNERSTRRNAGNRGDG